MAVELHVPRLSEMAFRQTWLSDPATMAHNRGRDLGGAEGYHPDTGCIDFPRENWRWWRQVWLLNEPDFYAAYIRDTESGLFVGEVCWYRDGEDFNTGILLCAAHALRGFLRAGFHRFGSLEGQALMLFTREDFETGT